MIAAAPPSGEHNKRTGEPDADWPGWYAAHTLAACKPSAASELVTMTGVTLGTIRFLNCFLDDPENVPAAVVDYVAEQLGLDGADLKGYGEKEAR